LSVLDRETLSVDLQWAAGSVRAAGAAVPKLPSCGCQTEERQNYAAAKEDEEGEFPEGLVLVPQDIVQGRDAQHHGKIPEYRSQPVKGTLASCGGCLLEVASRQLTEAQQGGKVDNHPHGCVEPLRSHHRPPETERVKKSREIDCSHNAEAIHQDCVQIGEEYAGAKPAYSFFCGGSLVDIRKNKSDYGDQHKLNSGAGWGYEDP